MAKHMNVEKIAKSMSTLDIHDYGDVLQCMRCGSCLPYCPTYRTDGIETQSPRGRVAMIKAVIDGRLTPEEEFARHMYHCLDCRNCQTVCPAGVKVGELVLEARHRIEQHTPQPLLKRFILESAIRDQTKLSRYLSPLRLYQNLGIQRLVRRSHILQSLSSDLDFMESLLPRLPDRPLIDTIPEIIPAAGQEKGKVGFFLGCAMNLVFADISRDTIHCLTQAGYTVIVPKSQQCCGTPNIAEGERKIYREMAEHNVSLFERHDVDAIVSDCAACGMELKSYRETLAPVTRASKRAEMFSGKVKDISEFLVSAFGPHSDFGSLGEKVCFHDPCHLRHGQNLVSPQRELLRRIPDLFLVDVPDEGQCCGSAGIYNITHRERSMKILEAKIAAIDKTGADRVITSNPGCLMQLQFAREQWKKSWSLSHISQVIRMSLEHKEA
ncbi:(Fe-S)-binding protein [Desulfomonile tiedjei]|uniref:Glycolate oxidase iron-sulfur subunit n=1 Tax=Desulfomonile tiedjei (strain ATCC 49306 / DSM 6799 / DCB-1) TaxID=706587 RepID=I4C5T1_DESTA|nr:(Fe-S)-binding protein [Desulfomonile tiedjei]AFM24922.1 Fe-S oxidoreductase [Desulfomonile tiedjei DSM 6799]